MSSDSYATRDSVSLETRLWLAKLYLLFNVAEKNEREMYVHFPTCYHYYDLFWPIELYYADDGTADLFL